MPQIWPMNWVILLTFFILVFILFVKLIYFLNMNLSSSKTTQHEIKSMSSNLIWKW